MKTDDVLHWVENQDINIYQVVIHIGLNDCRDGSNIMWSDITCAPASPSPPPPPPNQKKKKISQASVFFNSILLIRDNQDLNHIINFLNRRLESTSCQAGVIFIDNLQTFSAPSRLERYTDQFDLTKADIRKLAVN